MGAVSAPIFYQRFQMSVDVDICNMALDRIGSTDNIGDLDEESTAAEKCKFWYPICRDQTLRDFPWNFARRSGALAQVTGDAPPGWAFQYRYPSDCLTARQVTDAGGTRLPWCALAPGQSFLQWIPPRIPFDISSDDSGRLILTDMEEAYLVHTVRLTNLDIWDETAKSALAWKLANELVVPLSLDAKRKQVAREEYYLDLSRASAHNFNESGQDPVQESSSIQIRA
jgi:hypothetical protein